MKAQTLEEVILVVAATGSDSGQRCTRAVEALFGTSPMVVGWCRDDELQAPTTAELAVAINGAQFTADPVSLSSALWRSVARSPAGLLLLITGESGGAARAREQRAQLPFGHGSTIPPGEDDPFPRGDTGNVRTWSTGAPGNGIHRSLHQDPIERQQQSSPHPG